MSSGPCADCFSGFIHDGTPNGKISTIHGLPTYVAEPEEGVKPKGLIVMIHDAFGMELVNNKVLADRYAKRGGYLVYLPDFMGGSALPVSVMELSHKIIEPAPSWFAALFYKPLWVFQALISVIPWLIKTRPSVSKLRVISFFQALRTSPPPFPTTNLKIGAAGFCWGGKYTVLLCQDSPSTRVHRNSEGSSSTALLPLIDCGFTAHPSLLSMPKDIEEVVLPLSVAVGNEDMAMKGKDILIMKDILEKKKAGDHEVVIMPGAKHGFAIRNDPKDQLQMECAENAELQAIDWFKRWFS